MKTIINYDRREAQMRVTEQINNRIAELQKEIQELQTRLRPLTSESPEDPKPLNNLQNILKVYESRFIEVTGYRKPTAKKNYKYTPPKTGDLIGTDKDGKPVYF